MRKIGIFPVLLIGAALSGCGTIGFHLRNAFVNNFDGAGHFTTLVQAKSGTLTYIDSLDGGKGFDSACVLHVKIFHKSPRGDLWKEAKEGIRFLGDRWTAIWISSRIIFRGCSSEWKTGLS